MNRHSRRAAKKRSNVVPIKEIDRVIERTRSVLEREAEKNDPIVRFMARVSLLFVEAAARNEMEPRDLMRSFVHYAGFRASSFLGDEEAIGIFLDGRNANERKR